MTDRTLMIAGLLALGACASEPTDSGAPPQPLQQNQWPQTQQPMDMQPMDMAGQPAPVVMPPPMQPMQPQPMQPQPMQPVQPQPMQPDPQPMQPDPEPMQPDPEPMQPDPEPDPNANTPGTVTIEFTTVTYGGEYGPSNYGAVWFEDASGSFIKTAKRWAGTVHAGDLVAWTAASGGWGSIFGGGNQEDMVDAVSMPTIRSHQTHMVTWNMNDADMQLVPDGEYVAVLELTEDRARRPGPTLRIPFTKSTQPQTVDVPDEASFTGVSLQYTP